MDRSLAELNERLGGLPTPKEAQSIWDDIWYQEARWVYGQALEPGDWHDGQLLTISETRHIHYTAMTPVWDVAPYPEATDREGPGSSGSTTFTRLPRA